MRLRRDTAEGTASGPEVPLLKVLNSIKIYAGPPCKNKAGTVYMVFEKKKKYRLFGVRLNRKWKLTPENKVYLRKIYFQIGIAFRSQGRLAYLFGQ
jgi:hypothetical protein